MGTESKNNKLGLIQFWISCIALIVYTVLPFIPNLHEQRLLSTLQIFLGVFAIIFGGTPFVKAFNTEKRKGCCVVLIYLLIMAVCGLLVYMAYLPILQDAIASGVSATVAKLTHWVNVVSLVAFLSIFVATAADSGFIQSQLAKVKK